MAWRCLRRVTGRSPSRGTAARRPSPAESGPPPALVEASATASAATSGSTAGPPGRAGAPTVSPRRAGSLATSSTPAAATTAPASCTADGRSPAARPTANGINALVALIGATTLIVPIARAL